MRSRNILKAAALGLLAAGCEGSPTEPLMTAWEAVLAPTRPQAPRGTAGAVSEGSNTHVSLRVEAGAPATTYGWRVRTGPCVASGTGQVGGRAAYPAAVTDAQGDATVTGTVATRLLSREEYHVVITPADDETRTLACGALELVSS